MGAGGAGHGHARRHLHSRHSRRRALPYRPVRQRFRGLSDPCAAPVAAPLAGRGERLRPLLDCLVPPASGVQRAAGVCGTHGGPAGQACGSGLGRDPMVGRWGLALALPTGLATPAGQTSAPAALPAGTLHYAAHWRLLPAGRATLAWDGSGAERHIQFTAESSGLVSLFYPVQDRMHSTYDPGSFCTTAVDNDTLEGKRQRQTHIRFNAAMHQLTLDEVDTAHQPPVAKHEVKPIPGCVLDLFGALDYVRSQPLHVGDVYNFPVNEG